MWTSTATGSAVDPSNLLGSFTTVSSSGDANTVQQVGYIGNQRYLKIVMTISGATSGAASAATVTAGYPQNAPTQ